MVANQVHPFRRLGLPEEPLILAPLAGVSDHPFRRVCTRFGADLTYVEMISATAMLYESKRTFEMLYRHESEALLGVQITGPAADQVGRAVEILHSMPFDTIDINMGCPVKKVVKTGCGAAILQDPERVYQTLKAACNASDKPISAKFRLGWDQKSKNTLELAQAIEEGGAAWMTLHGRSRADDYAVPVDLEAIRQVKAHVRIPVIGNGNLFQKADVDSMRRISGVDGFMISRGALGNPWLFKEIKTGTSELSLDDWSDTVLSHLAWQHEAYGDHPAAAVCMRKHLLWYAKGWQGVKPFRESVNAAESLQDAAAQVKSFVQGLKAKGTESRGAIVQLEQKSRFAWDPKFEMDRQLDRGIGEDCLETLTESC